MSTNDDTRYGHRSGSGSNQPKGSERKEQDPEWRSRQGGNQTADKPDERSRGKRTQVPHDVATRPHLEGAEQGPR
jgi:hypothetical protein